MDFQLNSFNQIAVKGQLDLKLNLNVIPCKLTTDISDNTKIQEIINGDCVVLASAGNSKLPVVSPVEATDTYSVNKTYGFVALGRKQNKYVNNEVLSIALFGSTMFFEAGATLYCGDLVAFDIATKKIVANTTGAGKIEKIGVILNDCVDGDIVRVLLK